MSKKMIIAVIATVLTVAVFFVFKNIPYTPQAEAPKEEIDKNEIDKIKINPNMPGITLPMSNDPKDLAWALFQKYLSYNKDQNLEGVRSVVYKTAPVCDDPKTTVDCKARMGMAYLYGSALRKEDFVNVWKDNKQIILSTDFKIEEDDSTIGRHRSIIFFIYDNRGSLKMLSFSPFKGAVTSKGTASKEELDYRIVRYTEDNDQDGIADYDEECLGVKEGQICTKTDPKNRDTNSNGWWDGVEALMK